MESLLTVLVNTPASPEETSSYLNNLRGRSDVIMSAATAVNGASTALLLMLNDVPVERCVAGYMLLLSVQAEDLNESVYLSFLVHARRVFSAAAPYQLSFVHSEAIKVLRAVTRISVVSNKPRVVLNLLHRAIGLLSPSPSCLTAVHTMYLQACIQGQAYDAAVKFLRSTLILEISLRYAPLQGIDVVEYFYYAGICFIAVDDYDAALASFFQCMSIPANSLSAVVVSAIKKARLVALIRYGKELVTSMHVSSVVSRFLNQPMAGYDDLANAFALKDSTRMNAVLAAEASIFASENNLGLARRVVEASQRHQLKRLASTYISLSLSDIARRLQLPDTAAAERAVLKISRSGDIRARIDLSTGFVVFEVDAVSSSSSGSGSGSISGRSSHGVSNESVLTPQSARLLEECMRKTMELSNKLRDMHIEAITSHKYLVKNSTVFSRSMGPADGIPSMMGRGREMGIGVMGVMGSDYDYPMDMT